MNLNVCTISGRLGKDAELRTSGNGNSFTNFSIANNRGYGDKQETSWINCIVFGKTAENLTQYLLRGKLVVVTGELSVQDYTDKDGVKHRSATIFARDVVLAEPRGTSKPQEAAVPDDFDFDSDEETTTDPPF